MKSIALRTSLAAALSVVVAAPALAGGDSWLFRDSDPRLTVNPLPSGNFEVIEARGAGAQDIWCAAARFAERELGARGGRLYVAEPRSAARTEAGRKGVVFTLTPVGNAPATVNVSVGRVGENLRLGHARQFCRNYTREYRG